MLSIKSEKVLRNLGLNSYEVKIWTALLSRGISTAGELSDIANVPRSRSYDVLESLEKKGFVVMKAGKPINYLAVPPKEVVEAVKKNIRDNANVEVKKLSDLKNTDVLDELSSLHTQGIELVEPADLSGSLKGRQNLYNQIEYMLRKAQKFVMISLSQKEFLYFTTSFEPVFENLKRKNISVTVMTQLDGKTKKQADKIRNLVKVKNIPNKARFCIVDGKEILFMVMDDNEIHPTYDVGLWASTSFAKDLADSCLVK